MKTWATLVTSAMVLVVLSLCVAWVPLPWADSAWFRALPYVFFSIGAALGILFTQTRISFLCALFASILGLVSTFSTDHSNSMGLSATIFLASIYLPVITVLFYYLNERHILSLHGLLRAIIVLSVFSAVAFFPKSDILSRAIFQSRNALFVPLFDCCHIPLIGSLFFLGSIPFLLATHKRDSLSGASLIPALLFSVGALNFQSTCWKDPRVALAAFMCATALSLIAAVLQGSWHSMHTDELTELPGRRSMKHHLGNLTPPYSLAIVDVDFFKKINDRHGHSTGDEVLRYIAAHLRSLTIGRAYRYGGEEFVVVMDGKDFKIHVEAMDTLRQAISGREFWVRGKDRPRKKPEAVPASVKHKSSPKLIVTVSVGVAHSRERYESPAEVLDAADKALYRAKQDGRDRVKTAR